MSIFTISYSGADLGSCGSGRRTKGGKPTSRPWAASKQGLRPCCVDHWFPYPESTSSSSPREMTLLHSGCLWSECSRPSSFNMGEKPRLKPMSPSSWPQWLWLDLLEAKRHVTSAARVTQKMAPVAAGSHFSVSRGNLPRNGAKGKQSKRYSRQDLDHITYIPDTSTKSSTFQLCESRNFYFAQDSSSQVSVICN